MNSFPNGKLLIFWVDSDANLQPYNSKIKQWQSATTTTQIIMIIIEEQSRLLVINYNTVYKVKFGFGCIINY